MLHMMIYHHILKRKGINYPLMKCTKLFYPHDLKSGGIYPHSQKIIYNAGQDFKKLKLYSSVVKSKIFVFTLKADLTMQFYRTA